MDVLLELEAYQLKSKLRRAKSMEDFKTIDSSNINNNQDSEVSEKDSVYSFPAFKLDVDQKLNEFNEYMIDEDQKQRAENNKGIQYEDPEPMNIYNSPRDPPPEIELQDQQVQTMQEKKTKRGSESQNAERMAKQRKDMITKATILKK